MVTIENKLREERQKQGYTQEDLALKVQVSRQTINAIEAGRYKPSIVLALKLAAVFGVELETLFSLEPRDWE